MSDRASIPLPSKYGPNPDAAVTRQLLPQQVAGRIRDMIIEQDLVPGERIPEQCLSERLAVSRTPLREALRILATEGLVELLPNRGAIVANPGPEKIHDMLEVLAVLEGLAGNLACQQATDADIDAIAGLHDQMVESYRAQDRLAYFKLNQQIHLAIVRASRNDTLTEYHGMLNARLYPARYLSNQRSARWHSAVAEHEAILAALQVRDPGRLGDVLRAHLASTWNKVNEIMSLMGMAAE